MREFTKDVLISAVVVAGFVAAAMASGCAITELDDQVDEAVMQCEDIAAREREAALEQCSELLEDQIESFQAWIELYVSSIMARIGCVQDPDAPSGWDCSPICTGGVV